MVKILKSSFKKKIQFTSKFSEVERFLNQYKIDTICYSARCPNRVECFIQKKMTFMIMGEICTRNCKFCNVKKGIPRRLDWTVPERIKKIIKNFDLRYIIITSVTRDDLDDGGAEYFAFTVKNIKKDFPHIKIEILIPDFAGKERSLEKVVFSGADIVGHNIETIPRLYPEVRPMANFERSLFVLKQLKSLNPHLITKSGFMVGLGESIKEIQELLYILRDNGVDAVTIGQYFQPSKGNLPVKKYVQDEEFKLYEKWSKRIGFRYILSGRYVRSSSLEIRGK